MLWRGIPEHIRSDNGPEFIAQELRTWLAKVGTGVLYIEPGSPWENGYCESFNGKLRVTFQQKKSTVHSEQMPERLNTESRKLPARRRSEKNGLLAMEHWLDARAHRYPTENAV